MDILFNLFLHGGGDTIGTFPVPLDLVFFPVMMFFFLVMGGSLIYFRYRGFYKEEPSPQDARPNPRPED